MFLPFRHGPARPIATIWPPSGWNPARCTRWTTFLSADRAVQESAGLLCRRGAGDRLYEQHDRRRHPLASLRVAAGELPPHAAGRFHAFLRRSVGVGLLRPVALLPRAGGLVARVDGRRPDPQRRGWLLSSTTTRDCWSVWRPIRSARSCSAVSYALLDLAEGFAPKLTDTVVMETGGMKGLRAELPKEEFHAILCRAFGVEKIHSEYGMAELTSQAYSDGDGIFRTPAWMRVRVRDFNDPFEQLGCGRRGGVKHHRPGQSPLVRLHRDAGCRHAPRGRFLLAAGTHGPDPDARLQPAGRLVFRRVPHCFCGRRGYEIGCRCVS